MYRSAGRGFLPLVVLATALIASASTAHAQRRVFEWTGRVDHDVELTIRGGAFVTTRIGSDEHVSRGWSGLTALPAETGELSLKVVEGRGDVEVAQQPTPETGYTAVIRIHDRGNGTDTYRLDAYWQPVAAGEVVRMPPYESERERRRDIANRTALLWSGDVDSDVEIIIQPTGISYHTVRGSDPRALQSAFSEMPWPAAQLEINQIEGRGEASVIQQPTAENGFTAKVRVRDPQPGFGHYAFMVMWR